MSLRLQQFLLVALGVAGATVMVFLGLWQAQVFVDSGNRSVESRAAQAPTALAAQWADSRSLADVYGKQVVIDGRYIPDQYLLVPTEGRYRVLHAFQVEDGRILPVVRGVVDSPDAVPAPPAGQREEVGLFLPGEGEPETVAPDGMIGTVRLPLVPQYWPQPLVPGFVTLSAEDAAAHGLAWLPVALPEGEGAARNAGYALQWWVFAAAGLGFMITLAHSLGVRARAQEDLETLQAARTSPQVREVLGVGAPAASIDTVGTTTASAGASPAPTKENDAMSMSLDDSPIEAEDLPGIKGALLRYRVMAWITGILLVLLVVVGMPLKYIGGNDAVVVATGVPHGWLYMVLLLTAYDLGRRAKWPWLRLLLIGLGGTVPFMSFVAEHAATRDVHEKIAEAEARALAR